MSLDVQTYLNSFTNFESRLSSIREQSFDLKRVSRLLHVLGDPQYQLKFIHVAGTKGKGSTCALTAYILRAAGYRVGLYTSPHLYYVHERIRVLEPKASAAKLKDDFYGMISDRELNAIVDQFAGAINKIRNDRKFGNLTYFEVLTGLALIHFVRRKTDIVVLETGLGGRLDATNAVSAIVNGITPISLDHMTLLGSTIKAIAAEKAAVIKDPQSRVVIAPQPSEAMTVIKDRCRALGIKALTVGREIKIKTSSGKTFEIQTPQSRYKGLKINLTGEHQFHNAAMAVAMVELSGLKVSAKAVARGIGQTRWPARFEVVFKKPAVVIDCAHNTASAEVLVRSFKRAFPDKKAVLVLGVSNDKDVQGIGRILSRLARTVVTTQSAHPRAHHFSGDDAKNLFGRKFLINAKSVPAAVTVAMRAAGKRDAVVIAGSVFIAAEARALFRGHHVSI